MTLHEVVVIQLSMRDSLNSMKVVEWLFELSGGSLADVAEYILLIWFTISISFWSVNS